MQVKGKRMIKGGIPKPSKGGAPKPHQPHTAAPRLTAEQMLDGMNLYRDKMRSAWQVKTPENMPVCDEFLKQIEILKTFAAVKVDAPVFDKYETTYGGHQTYKECIELGHDNNLMVLLELLSIATMYSDMDDEYDRGFVNLLKIMVALYQGNPYTRNRIGWMMWAFGKHIYPKCYFPLTIDMYYDPRLWHRPGEYPKEPLPVPSTVAFDGSNQVFGPEDDIWDCELPDTGSGE